MISCSLISNHITNLQPSKEYGGYAHARLLQSCLTPCGPMDCSCQAPMPMGFSAHGLLQARILAWVAMPSSRGSSLPRDWTHGFLHLLHWQAGSFPLAPPGKPKSMVLAQKQTHKLMEQSREPREELTRVQAICNKGVKNIQWGKKSFSINDVGKAGQLHAKESSWTMLSHRAQK